MIVRLALLVALLTGVGTAGHAAYLYDWAGGSNVVSLGDPAGDAAPGQDILGIWWARDASSIYVRMDLASTPATTLDYTYGLYADVRPAYGSTANFPDVPHELSGIDYYVSLNFNGATPVAAFHQWMVGGYFAYQALPPGYYQATENSGRTLEWRLPVAYIDGNYGFWGAVVQNVVDPSDTLTRDITSEGNTPEPATLALLGLGLGGIIIKRRRRS